MTKLPQCLLFLFLGALVSVVIFPLAPREAAADVVHLRTGESIKGRPIQGRCDEKVLVIEDFMSGATRTIQWVVVDPEDRIRLQEDMGIINKAMMAIEGHRIVIELLGGATDTLRGLIVSEDDQTVTLLRGGKELPVQKSMITSRDTEEMDPRDIWSPEQLVQRFLDSLAKDEAVDVNNLDTRQHFRVAEYAEKAGDFETAKLHYTICKEDPEFLLSNVVVQRLERVEALLRDAAALADLRQMRVALSLKSFRRVREMVEEFATQHPDAAEAIQIRLEQGKKEFAERRAAFFELEAKINFPKIVLRLIKGKVQENEIGLADASRWTKSELPELAFAELAELLNKKDDVSVDEARAFWENRPKSAWRTATYGAGTFIVEPPKIKPPKPRKPPANQKSKGGSAAPAPQIPKPPTRDQWWETAGTAHRESWIMAYFAENSGLFEVSDTPKYSDCQKCNGKGLESKTYQTGAVMEYLCTRCAGAQRDKRVRFR